MPIAHFVILSYAACGRVEDITAFFQAGCCICAIGCPCLRTDFFISGVMSILCTVVLSAF
jgi:hypothetical protein